MTGDLQVKMVRESLHQLVPVNEPRSVLIQVKKSLLHVCMLLEIVLFHNRLYRLGDIILILIELSI